jgi:predicted DNA binding CopG/RHH family protein
MLLTQTKLQYLNSVTHEGKVVTMGTDAKGKIWYTIKQDGYEDSFLDQTEAERTGWEEWQELQLPGWRSPEADQGDHEIIPDASVVAKEAAELTYERDGEIYYLHRSIYDSYELTQPAPVQLISGLGHLYVFRQSIHGTLLVDRFVLDAIVNKLVPKLEVRYRRSGQKYEPAKPSQDNQDFDSLSYIDINGDHFYEPTTELSVINQLQNGWFSVVLLPTNEHDQYRWNFFVYQGESRTIELISIRASSEGLFDTKDYTVFEPSLEDPKTNRPRSIPGIIRRTLDLGDRQAVGHPAATKYDLQVEQLTQEGEMQLLRQAVRVMALIPTDDGETAALSFAAATDGTLSQVSENVNQSQVLRGNERDMLLPLNTLDEIRSWGDLNPPPEGSILKLERGEEDLVTVTTPDGEAADLRDPEDKDDRQDTVAIKGTQSLDGHYQVTQVDKGTLELDLVQNQAELGSWEVIPEKETGLIFDGMITAYEITPEQKLKLTAFNHGLESGDQVQVIGTRDYNGTYPVKKLSDESFALEGMVWQPGEALNLQIQSRRRRGCVFAGGDDRIDLPPLPVTAPSSDYGFGRTYCAWIYLPSDPDGEPLIVGETYEQFARLLVKNGQVTFQVHTSDGSTAELVEIQDPDLVFTEVWVHYGATLAHHISQQNQPQQTTLAICKNGIEVASRTIEGVAPLSATQGSLRFNGQNQYGLVDYDSKLNPEQFTVSAWVRVTEFVGTRWDGILSTQKSYAFNGYGLWIINGHWEFQIGNASRWLGIRGYPVQLDQWTHLTGTYDGETLIFYINGQQVGDLQISNYKTNPDRALYLGAWYDQDGSPQDYFWGDLAEVRVWDHVRPEAAIKGDMQQRLKGDETGLVGYWPLVNGEAKDYSGHGHDATLYHAPTPATGPNLALSYQVGAGFSGRISDLQIWDQARSATAIKNTMHLQLTGREVDLAGYWRLGAIVEDPVRQVIDFTAGQSNNGLVYGDLFVSEMSLERYLGNGQIEVVKYSNEELFAVTQRATYMETFEFQIVPKDGGPDPVDPNDVDGSGTPIFQFYYWGKLSRSADQWVEHDQFFSEQSVFQKLPNGWYLAQCRFTVPEQVSVLRSFQLNQVEGEWTTLQIRNHHIRLVSDTVTEAIYIDDLSNLETLVDRHAPLETDLDTLTLKEDKEGELLERKWQLEADIALLEDTKALDREIQNLEDQKERLEREVADREQAYNHARSQLLNHWCRFIPLNNLSGSGIRLYGGNANLMNTPEANRWQNNIRFNYKLDPVPNVANCYTIYSESGNRRLYSEGGRGKHIYSRSSSEGRDNKERWLFEKIRDLDSNQAEYTIRYYPDRSYFMDKDLSKGKNEVHLFQQTGGDNQKWRFIKVKDRSDGLIGEAKTAWEQKQSDLNKVIENLEEKLAYRENLEENLANLRAELEQVNAQLQTLQTEIVTLNTNFINALAEIQQTPQAMAQLHQDWRKLITQGAALGFVRSVSRISAMESCEGQVVLSYFDQRGRMRQTRYDATADSRNPTFEQWIPDSLRACVSLSQDNSKIDLAEGIDLGGTWSLEGWFSYPLSVDKSRQPWYVLANSPEGRDCQIAIYQGRELGVVVAGKFFGSGYNLEQIEPGWHHVALTRDSYSTTESGHFFYLDGAEIGYAPDLPLIQLNGKTDYISCGDEIDLKEKSFTIEFWARRSATGSRSYYAIGQGENSENKGLHIGFRANDRFAFAFYGNDLDTDAAYTDSEWHHWACVYSHGTIKEQLIYCDGVLVKERETNHAYSGSGDFYIGRSTGGEHFAGQLAEVRVWHLVRSQQQIQASMGRSLQGDESGLIAYWKLDNLENGNKFKDYSNNNHEGNAHGQLELQILPGSSSGTIQVLGNNPAGTQPFSRLANLGIWNIALSAAEVAAHSKGELTGNEPGLEAYYPMQEATGNTIRDYSANSNHGTAQGLSWWGFAVPIGHPGHPTMLFDGQSDVVYGGNGIALANQSFSIEFWARRSTIGSSNSLAIGQGEITQYQGLNIGFRGNNHFVFSFYHDDLDTDAPYTDSAWHHWACVYSHGDATKKRWIYCDGVLVQEGEIDGDGYAGSGDFYIGRGITDGSGHFVGELADVRVWKTVRSAADIEQNRYRRLTGQESGLVAYWPLDDISDGVAKDLTGNHNGTLQGNIQMVESLTLPIGENALVRAEYSTVNIDPITSQKISIMRQFLAHPVLDGAQLWYDKRIEELELRWVGNAQFMPTLLGYIEGAPPVPSENLTEDDDLDYGGATSVALNLSQDVEFSWTREQDLSVGTDSSMFWGLDSELSLGLIAQKDAFSVRQGMTGDFSQAYSYLSMSTVTTGASSVFSDQLALTGNPEFSPQFAHLGNRFIPKNVGYALVISGLADVFISRLKRSRKMVSYQMEPSLDIPFDINTITFLMNPTYVLNGSLDGLVGSSAADERFYRNLEDMRAQYGSLYPASYYRLQEAYGLKQRIEQQDSAAQSYFVNFNSQMVDEISLNRQVSSGGSQTPALPGEEPGENPENPDKTLEEILHEIKEQLDELSEAQAEKETDLALEREQKINQAISDYEQQVHATDCFNIWQKKMESLQIRAGKHNIVNTYIWDADGGLRSESQQFASTVEHSIGGSYNYSLGFGGEGGTKVMGLGFELSAGVTNSLTQTMNKTESRSRGMSLDIDLSGVEGGGVTDNRDYPLLPGEKVNRYRLMSFYLSGHTDYFHEFFTTVVDPEWLASNSESARALRQVQAGRPNKTWRVLHRVTYVERPALMGFGQDQRRVQAQGRQQVARRDGGL